MYEHGLTLATAQQRFQAGLAIAERLAAADPSNTA
jgi:hypothetical protein